MMLSENIIKASYSLVAAIISMLFVYWIYQLIDFLSTLENNIVNLPYLIRMALYYLDPEGSADLIKAHSKLKLLAYTFLLTYSIKSFLSIRQGLISSTTGGKTYMLVLIFIEGAFLYYNLNIEINDVILFLIFPNIIIFSLLDN
jgi:hypothetical protein